MASARMTEDQAYLKKVHLMASRLSLQIVKEDGVFRIRRLFEKGDSRAPDEKEVETFTQYMRNNKDRFMAALGVKPAEVDVEPAYRRDMEALLAWLEKAGDGIAVDAKGQEWDIEFHVKRLVDSAKPSLAWILDAYKFKKAIESSREWRSK